VDKCLIVIGFLIVIGGADPPRYDRCPACVVARCRRLEFIDFACVALQLEELFCKFTERHRWLWHPILRPPSHS
jgi:hypothetical protein